LIDYEAVRSSRKVFVGFSDITALHIAIHRRARLVTFHGAVAHAGSEQAVSDYNNSSLLRVITSREPAGELHNPPGEPPPVGAHGGRSLGRLVGGNLSLITASIGTPYEIDTRGAILAVEEVTERPYRLDRMLRQLKLAGKLDGVAGIVLGEFVRCEADPEKPSLSREEVLEEYFGGLGVPVVSGLRFGHGAYRLTLPLGVMAEIDGDCGSLAIVEPAVA
ncbi:MAG: S66 peptidase family protein, partial [Bacillota bacterium]